MKLERVQIKNFRSIKDSELRFNKQCIALVGINESGKSNVLKALSYLANDKAIDRSDIRLPLKDDILPAESFIRFIFNLDESEILTLQKLLASKCLASLTRPPLITVDKTGYSGAQLCRRVPQALLRVDLESAKRGTTTWALPTSSQVAAGWMVPSKNCPADFAVQVTDGTKVLLHTKSLIFAPAYPAIPTTYLSPADVAAVNLVLATCTRETASANLPKCLLWAYDANALLPAQIDIASFQANPSSCLPLTHMFELAGISDAPKAIGEALKTPGQALRNLLERVSTIATDHVRKSWRDYKKVEILLEPNGAKIEASIRETFNRYAFLNRSDGFKRFVTFLLLVSAPQTTDRLTNTLILVDEPDASLHPSGARYLRDELIRIATKNLVVYSTHSIFMIDENNPDRHRIVEKEGEITTLTEINSSNVVDEEVIYRALRYSVFDTLRRRNLVFEGWRDKQLFSCALLQSTKKLRKKFDGIGRCHLFGLKDVGRVIPILELADRDYIIISDCDQIAITGQRSFKGTGIWKKYNDLVLGTLAVTSEDFFTPEAFKKSVTSLAAKYPTLAPPPADIAECPRMEKVNVWLTQSGKNKDERGEIANELKDSLFNRLDRKSITKEYQAVIKAIDAAVDTMKA